MQLELTSDQFKIHLNWYERLLAFYMAEQIAVPLRSIQQVSAGQPEFTWRAVRLPGTSLPGVIAAGTYYTDQGREFWYVTGKHCLTLTIDDDYFKRIILTQENADDWANRIRQASADL